MAAVPIATPAGSPGLVVIGTSLGGLNALAAVLGGLPPTLAVPVVVVRHLADHSATTSTLQRVSALPVEWAGDGALAPPGHVYLAPPHTAVGVASFGGTATRLLVRRLAPERWGATVDTTFELLAGTPGLRPLAVVLTGLGHDATAGVRAISAAGGTVLAQDEATSEAFGMPGSAIATGLVDLVLPLSEIAPAIVRLVAPAGLR